MAVANTKSTEARRRIPGLIGRLICCVALYVSIPTTVALDKAALTAALNSNDRDVAHLLRDESRHPLEVIEFLGIDSGMQVLDIYAADGYYSYILAKVVGPQGRVFAQNPPAGSDVEDIRQMYSLADALDARIATANLSNLTHLRENFSDLSIAPASLDGIMLVQILHDFHNGNPQFATALLTQLATLLKPGGIVAIIDHAGDPDQDNSRLHRMVKAEAIDVAQDAGLVLVGDSDLLSNVRDRRRRPVFDPMLGRDTDRFLLKFQKPLSNQAPH